MPIVYLGLGSNLGDRQAHLDAAIQQLEDRGCRLLVASSVLETDPVGGPPQGKFLNAVIQCETRLAPAELLTVVKLIERAQGREDSAIPNAPRPLDIDILLYDDMKMSSQQLTIPHPRMIEREFVMIPLREVEPNIQEVIDRCL